MNSTLPSTLALLDYEHAIARVILSTVIEATPALGRPPSRSFVASVLVGSIRRDLVAAEAHRLSTFGVFSRHGMDACCEWIDTLVAKGYLEALPSRRGVVCTMLGRSILVGLSGLPVDPAASREPLGLIELSVNAPALDLAVRSGLIEALRRYHATTANEREIPEYRLFSEATLRQLGTTLPETTSALEEIPGLGPKRVAEHGPELLRIVAEHKPVIERLKAATMSERIES